MEITAAELHRRFAGASAEILSEVRSLLASFILECSDPAIWASYGEATQRRAGALLSDCLAASDRAKLRALPRHLTRLQCLLQKLAAAFQSGSWLRPANPLRAWGSVRTEIGQLAEALDQGLPEIVGARGEIAQRAGEARHLQMALRAAGLGADILMDKLGEPCRSTLIGRQASLLASESLMEDLSARLALEEMRLAALAEQVRDGVLVQLPGLMGALAGLPARPNETQRFLLAEKLAELTRLLERK